MLRGVLAALLELGEGDIVIAMHQPIEGVVLDGGVNAELALLDGLVVDGPAGWSLPAGECGARSAGSQRMRGNGVAEEGGGDDGSALKSCDTTDQHGVRPILGGGFPGICRPSGERECGDLVIWRSGEVVIW